MTGSASTRSRNHHHNWRRGGGTKLIIEKNNSKSTMHCRSVKTGKYRVGKKQIGPSGVGSQQTHYSPTSRNEDDDRP
jgi:hypothetical protein